MWENITGTAHNLSHPWVMGETNTLPAGMTNQIQTEGSSTVIVAVPFEDHNGHKHS